MKQCEASKLRPARRAWFHKVLGRADSVEPSTTAIGGENRFDHLLIRVSER